MSVRMAAKTLKSVPHEQLAGVNSAADQAYPLATGHLS
jgi:hypothetical protein